MAKRRSSELRRQEIVSATLELLAEYPLDQISTRRVAKAVGLSQPALFRHFRSREAILLELLAEMRRALEELARGVLAEASAPKEALLALLRGLFRHASEHPGLPRLLFHDAANESDTLAFRKGLRHLVSMQEALTQELLRGAVAAGLLPKSLSTKRASELLVASVQGELLQQRLGRRDAPPECMAEELFALFWAGVEAGHPQAIEGEGETGHETLPKTSLAFLDTRPILAEGEDPFDAIRERLASLTPHGTLLLLVPFRPNPLLTLLESRGYHCEVQEGDGGLFEIRVATSDAPELTDLRDLETPGPLEASLEACTKLAPGETFLARYPRMPRLLLPRLQELGLRHDSLELPDASTLLFIEHSGDTSNKEAR